MAAAFSNPAVDGFELSPANLMELVTAYEERYLAGFWGVPGWGINGSNRIGTAGPFSLQGGESFKTGDGAKPIFLNMQTRIETLCTAFIDHAAVSGSGPTDLALYTWTTFKAAAGLGAGWRRFGGEWNGGAAPAFDSGRIQNGDILGWWIWEDLVKAFQALKWTRIALLSGATGTTSKHVSDTPHAAYATAVSNYDAAWAAAAFGAASYGSLIAGSRYYDGSGYGFNGTIGRSKFSLTLPAALAGLLALPTVDVWAVQQASGANPFFSGIGQLQDKFYLVAADDVPAAFGAAKIYGSPIDDYNGDPVTEAGVKVETASTLVCASNLYEYAAAKWAFTNA